jgi:hypothetical protein
MNQLRLFLHWRKPTGSLLVPVLPGRRRCPDSCATWSNIACAARPVIDLVGTGYSRASRPDFQRRFNGFEGDVQSVGEFIRLYLTRNQTAWYHKKLGPDLETDVQ